MLLGSRSNQSRLPECEIGVSRIENLLNSEPVLLFSANETLILCLIRWKTTPTAAVRCFQALTKIEKKL